MVTQAALGVCSRVLQGICRAHQPTLRWHPVDAGQPGSSSVSTARAPRACHCVCFFGHGVGYAVRSGCCTQRSMQCGTGDVVAFGCWRDGLVHVGVTLIVWFACSVTRP